MKGRLSMLKNMDIAAILSMKTLIYYNSMS
jgi:hypothetical protein